MPPARMASEETHYLESFRFLGVVVERREVDPKGNPLYPTIGDKGYEAFDVGKAYGPLVILSDRQTEEEDKALVDISQTDGLVMPRLRSMRDNQYPPIEKELKKIQETLADIEKAKKGNENLTLGIIQNFTDDVDPFHPGNRRVVANDRAAAARGAARRPSRCGRPSYRTGTRRGRCRQCGQPAGCLCSGMRPDPHPGRDH